MPRWKNSWKDRFSKKSFLSSVLFTVIFVTLASLVNVPMQYVDSVAEVVVPDDFSGIQYHVHQELPVMGGWPFRYLIRYRSDHQINPSAPVRYWSWIKLVADVLLIFGGGACLFWFVSYRDQKITAAKNRSLTQRSFDILFALVIVLLPTGFLAAVKVKSVRQHSIVTGLADQAAVTMRCWLPSPIAEQVPLALRSLLEQPRQVEAYRIDNRQLLQLARLDSITGLRFIECEFDSRNLQSFRQHPHLASLEIRHQKLTQSAIGEISKLPHLRKLALHYNNADLAALSSVFSMENLTKVDFRGNPLKLSEFPDPRWAKTVRELSLTRPDTGQADRLTIEDWPNLERLSIKRPSYQNNEVPLSITLSKLPRLESFRLDRRQVHALDLSDLPRLNRIQDSFQSNTMDRRSNAWLPDMPWFSSLTLNRMPAIESLHLYARDLEHLQMEDVPNLKSVTLGSRSLAPQPSGQSKVWNHRQCQNWIQAMGQQHGPRNLMILNISLEGIDLSPLAGNDHLRSLTLKGCQISQEQVRAIPRMERLTTLNLGNYLLPEDGVHELLTQFPRLQNLTANGAHLKQINLVGQNPLTYLQVQKIDHLDRVHVVDQAKLNTKFRFTKSPQSVVIKNSPAIRGVIFENPLRTGVQLSGLRDLEIFSGAGPELNDAVFETVVQCPAMDQLTLIHPQLSPTMLRQIGQLDRLTVLVVPGAAVNDEIIQSWESLRSLWEINLDDNDVGQPTLQWLSQNPSLRSVSLARVRLDDTGLESLSLLTHVSRLCVSELPVKRRHLTDLLQAGSLTHLDLSGCDVNDALLDEITASLSLRELNVHGCDLKPEQLARLRKQLPELQVVMTKTDWTASGLIGDKGG